MCYTVRSTKYASASQERYSKKRSCFSKSKHAQSCRTCSSKDIGMQELLDQVEDILGRPKMAFARLGVDINLYASRAQKSIAVKVDLEPISQFLTIRKQCCHVTGALSIELESITDMQGQSLICKLHN